MKPWLLLLDLDGTLWDHHDISSLKPPFKKAGKNTIIDSNGVEVRAYEDMINLLKWAKTKNAITSTLSWNIKEIAIEALKTLELTSLFDYLTIEPHPRKDLMLKKLLKTINKERGVKIPPCRIVYIDDREIHIREIYENIGTVNFLKAWKSFRNLQDCITKIEKKLSNCTET